MASTIPSQESLPGSYDELLSVDRLVHGKHNPRRVAPTPELQASIEQDGIQQPLIVRPDGDQDFYHITDGWQRYQVATDLGWEQLPVQIHETPLAALKATERESIVREWSSYEWAQYCQSVATELEAESAYKLSQQVARQTVKSPQTVRRYLRALSLPEVVHPLLQNGPEGTTKQWQALANYNDNVRRYDGFSWRVGAQLGRHVDEISEERVLAIAAQVVEYQTTEQALAFVQAAVEQPETPLRTVHRQVEWDGQHAEYLKVPRVAMEVKPEHKEALMAYCAETRQPLAEVVKDQLQEFITEL